MHHYVAFWWRPENHSARMVADRYRAALAQSAHGWHRILDCDGLAIYSREPVDPLMRVYPLKDHGGAIFGRLFRSGSPGRDLDAADVEAEEIDAAHIVRSRGSLLLDKYWGGYVAIIRPREEQTAFVMRDCSGRIPCYYVNMLGLYVFFSDIQDIEPLGMRYTLNPLYLAAYIHRTPVHARRTALQEVSELLAGDCVSLSPTGISQHCVWDPRLIAQRDIIDDYHEAEARLRAVTEQVISAWASVTDRILLKLSGGLDSAIVLGCLKRANCAAHVVCINHYTESTDDDERAYARSAASMADVPLIELPRISDAGVFAEKLRNLPPDPNPDVPRAMGMLGSDGMTDIARRFGCKIVWTGQGGDHVFLQLNSAQGAIDYLLQHPFPYRMPRLMYDSAVLSGESIWHIAARAAHYWRHRAAAPAHPFECSGASLMHQAAIAELPETYTVPHWHASTGKIPPGKQTQIDVFWDLLNRHKPTSGLAGPFECHPLISQPLLELSLRIPTYHLLRGGRQRAMARAAFADRVPPAILGREDKGSIRDQSRSLIRGSSTILRDILLDGTLVSLGILNRARLEEIIVAQDTYRDTEILALLGCIAVEMWAMHWTHHSTPQAPG